MKETNGTPAPKDAPRKESFSSRVLSDAPKKQPAADKKLMKRFRRAKKIPSSDEVVRFTPALDQGLTQEQVDEARRVAESADFTQGKWDRDVMEVIVEEADGYFNGDRALEDVVRNIQSRVELIISESQ